MPDVTIEPWMREAAKQIDDYANTYDFMDAEPEESQILFARAIATAYAARERQDVPAWVCDNCRKYRPNLPGGWWEAEQWVSCVACDENKSALAGETR